MPSTTIEQLRREYISGLRRHVGTLQTELDQALAEIALAEQHLGITPAIDAPVKSADTSVNVKPDEFRGMTTDAAIKKLLSWGTSLSAPKIADLLYQGGQGTSKATVKANVYSALKRLKEKKAAIRGDDGLWQLVGD